MKTLAIQYHNLESFGFEEITQNELNEVRGGVKPPKSRDKDVFDFEEE